MNNETEDKVGYGVSEKEFKEILEEEIEKNKPEQYKVGYEIGKNDYKKKLEKDNCVKEYIEGYKTGYSDGYNAAMKDLKEVIGNPITTEEIPMPSIHWP